MLASLVANVLSNGLVSELGRGAPGTPGTCTSYPSKERPRESSPASHPTCLPSVTALGGAVSLGNNRRRAEEEGGGGEEEGGVQILKPAVAASKLRSSSDLS